MNKVYFKDLVRIDFSLFDVKVWYEGESKELEKLIGFGFYNSIFVSENGNVTIYYDEEESDNFYRVLDEVLTEEFFDDLCGNFFDLIESGETQNNDQIYDLSTRIWPVFVIFHEISNNPEYGNDSMLRRLLRIRESTESFSYELSKKVEPEKFPKDYIFFKDKLYYEGFDNFIKENNIKILG